ncbi:hypothetical protein V8E55_011731 [Tylopilus felleus]
MAKTILPSWVGRAPRNLGCSSHGKLKADQWRTACLVNLIITLATAKETALLRNFLSLVIAIRWATMRCITPVHIAIVEDHLVYYTKSTAAIFGEKVLVVNNHASLHTPECLRAFGPVQGWWAFPFERFNGIIQRLNTNDKLGQMEGTFMKTFCKAGNLRALMARDTLPDALESFRPLITKYFGSALNGAILSDIFSPDSVVVDIDEHIDAQPLSTKRELLDDPVYQALLECLNSGLSQPPLLERLVQYHNQITFKGVTFTTSDRHTGNSLILFKTDTSPLQRAAEIQKIFTHTRRRLGDQPEMLIDFFCVVRQYQELTDEEITHDPYRVFTLLETRICCKDFLPGVMVIQPSHIISHFASCLYELDGFGNNFQVVLSLNRVGDCCEPIKGGPLNVRHTELAIIKGDCRFTQHRYKPERNRYRWRQVNHLSRIRDHNGNMISKMVPCCSVLLHKKYICTSKVVH